MLCDPWAICRCAAANSSGVLTFPSAGIACSRSGTPLAITSLRGQLRPARDRLAHGGGRLGLEDRAQRLGQAIVRAAIGSDRLLRLPRRDEPRKHLVVDEGQVAGEHQPRRLRVRSLRSGDAGDRPAPGVRVDDLRVVLPHGVGTLIGANGHEDALAMPAEQLVGPVELRAAVEFERGLVALHARARAAGQEEPIEWRAIDRAVHVRAASTSRLPPCFAMSRVSAITISCDSALHMS